MSPTATIQLTTMEFVMGNPNTLAISTGFFEGKCSASSGVTDPASACTVVSADVVELGPAWAALALPATRQITAAAKIDISLVFKSSTWSDQWAHFETFHSPLLTRVQLSAASSVLTDINLVQHLYKPAIERRSWRLIVMFSRQ